MTTYSPEELEHQAQGVMRWYDGLPRDQRELVNEWGVRAWNKWVNEYRYLSTQDFRAKIGKEFKL